MIVTKWQHLGYGLSPSEEHWGSHLERFKLPWPYSSDDMPGSIQASYEDQPGIKFDSLLKPAEAEKCPRKDLYRVELHGTETLGVSAPNLQVYGLERRSFA